MNRKQFAACLMLILIGLTVTKIGYSTTSKATASVGALSVSTQTTAVKVYLVAVGDDGKKGKKIGCNDSLIPVGRTIQPTSAPLKAALDELLAMPEEYNAGSLQLGNYWKGSDLKVKSVALKGGTATIHITGTLTVAGVCDEPRITEQIKATARQFPTVKRVKVFVNGIALEQAIR